MIEQHPPFDQGHSILRSRARESVWRVFDALARPTTRWRVLPDYLIIGAQRCGTTSLQALLTQHPNIRPPRLRKGVHYFDTGFRRGANWYRSQFPLAATMGRGGSAAKRMFTGEASPYYLFHPSVPGRIASVLPNIKLIVLLRDPVERAISHHKHEQRRGFEELGLEAALDAEADRLAGEEERLLADPFFNSFAHQHFSYVTRGHYADQLGRYLAVFPSSHLLVLEAEALWSAPASTIREISSFLELPDWEPDSFPRRNATTPSRVDPNTRLRLEEMFAAPNRRLVDLMGQKFSWT